jgi:hypothetical protein
MPKSKEISIKSSNLSVKLPEKTEIDDLKQKLKDDTNFSDHPDQIFKGLYNLINGKEDKGTPEAANKLKVALNVLGLENHQLLQNSVKDIYRGFSIEFANTLSQEFDCKTPSEKSLAQIAVNAYIRTMVLSQKITGILTLDHISPLLNAFLGNLSKELDRAERQYFVAMEKLKQFKNPPVKVNIKTNTAFVGQNQQFNNNAEPNEIINP